MPSRRTFIKNCSWGLTGLPFFSPYQDFLPANREKTRFLIGACDWSIGKMADIDGLKLGRELGLDGIQISCVNQNDDLHLNQKSVRQAYQKAAKTTQVQIGGLAIGRLNEIPYKSSPIADLWVLDSIEIAKKLNVKVLLLAFFSKGDLKGDKAGTDAVISKLKKAAPLAEKAGVVLGIESWLSAEEHMYIIDSVASPNLQVYYDVANSHKMGYDIYEEIRWLGKKGQICEFHLKENGYLLGRGNVDFSEVRRAIDEIEYDGWIIMEGAVPPDTSIAEAYQHNQKLIKALFPE